MKKNCLHCSKCFNCELLNKRRKTFNKLTLQERLEKIDEELKPCEDFAEDMAFSNIFTKSLMSTAANSSQALPAIHIGTININISIEKIKETTNEQRPPHQTGKDLINEGN